MTQPPENHQPGGQFNAQPGPQGRPAPQGTPLPQDLSAGWLPEDKRQKPVSPLPEPRFFAYQSILPTKVLHALRHPAEIPWLSMRPYLHCPRCSVGREQIAQSR